MRALLGCLESSLYFCPILFPFLPQIVAPTVLPRNCLSADFHVTGQSQSEIELKGMLIFKAGQSDCDVTNLRLVHRKNMHIEKK